MRIAVDLHGIQSDGSRSRGIGRYSFEIIRNIIISFPNHDVILIANAALSDLKKEFSKYLNYENVTYLKWFAPCPFDFVTGNIEKRKIAKILKSYTYKCVKPDIILVTSFFEGYADSCLIDFDRDFLKVPIVSIFYDLIPLLNSDLYLKNNPDFKRFYYQRLNQLNKLDALLAISQSSAQEAIKYLPMKERKVFNISSAYNSNIFNKDSDIASYITIDAEEFTPFILYSGAIDPRKNVKRLIEAFSKLPRKLEKYKLVLVGKLLPVEEEIIDHWINSYQINSLRVIRTGYLSDHDLVELYRKCELFVFPSLHEGFGLPVLEAMACGAPVIGSNCTSIPEVIGLESAMFNPNNVDEIANLIVKALTSYEFNDVLRKNSLSQIKQFSWSSCAQAAIKACEAIVNLQGNKVTELNWNSLIRDRDQDLKFMIEKLRKINHLKTINNKYKTLYQVSASIDKITIQVDSILRALSKVDEDISWKIEGPFDSSYSLSILNRSFAKAMNKKVNKLSINITEGFGDYPPNISYLKQHPQIYSLYENFDKATDFNVMSRNLYPPRVSDMNAKFNILHSYGWEESSFPSDWVDEFNSSLQGITVMSRQVKKILIDNGVVVPIKVSGLGLDHLEDINSTDNVEIKAKKFKILHVSSCFPRKGIDILLKAFADSFNSDDNVSLIIKTFDNPHNKIDILLQHFRETNSNFPDVIVIKDDYNDSQIRSLYEQANLLIAPSRGEGFGLPIAEAMLLGVPVITTNWGGQLDFCNNLNSWLIDYDFAHSKSHFNLDFSYWAEPKLEDLSKLIMEVYESPASEIIKKINFAKESVRDLKWTNVADKNISFINDELLHINNSQFKIGWISTWNQKCGIASYSRNIIECIIDDIIVFSPFKESSNLNQISNVIPSWEYPFSDSQNLDQLLNEVLKSKITSLVIQFNYSFFDLREFSNFVNKVIDKNINLIIVLHSTISPDNLKNKDITYFIDSLQSCNRVFVHTINDLNRLKNIGLVENVSLFPHPIKNVKCSFPTLKSFPNKNKKLMIGSYGFCLPNKGFYELISAVPLLKKLNLNFHLNIFSAIYSNDYEYCFQDLLNLIKDLSVENEVTLIKDYLDADDVSTVLNEQDLIVYPYQNSNESSSASVRDGLSSLKPILVTPLPIFDDVSDLVDYFQGMTPFDLANGINSWYRKSQDNPVEIEKLNILRAKLIQERTFSKLSLRLYSTINSLEINKD